MPLPGSGDGGESGSSDQAGDSSEGQEGAASTPGDASASGGSSESGSGAADAAASESDVDDAGEQAGEDGEPTFEQPSAAASSSSSSSASLEDLEKILNEELGTFDGQILDEQQNARQGSTPAENESVANDPAGIGDFQTFPSSGGRSAGQGGTAAAGAPASSSGGATATSIEADIPPPSADDDIVARQLYEAAVAEPDPTIRAALWEEYYRYKDGR